ncbi:MAG: hypothetical protein A2X12_05750 [Bacteroidetes bacterium GWE2_29_8]|nr:MAG: hypothetical protein A2X12_05750 [Bacteroidetes bacterium GWE2_29_8]OFY24495.1 MAG: hypothetical protein A2X02_01765 [Bacteroidetes bacterium GWF2_29_10]
MRRLLKFIFNYFLQGLLFLAPITITGYLIYRMFIFIDALLPFDIPGLGIIVIISGVTLIGYIGKKLFTESFSSFFEDLIKKAPIINIIYNSSKEILTGIVGQKKKFNQPVLVRLNKNEELYKLGFITQKNLAVLGVSENKIAVYLPHSFGFTGNLFITSIDNITLLNIPPVNVTKFIISGGLINIDNIADLNNNNNEQKTEDPNYK